MWTWAVVPTLLIAGPRLWGAQLYEVRYLAYSAPAVAILVGVGVSTYAGVVRRALVAALVLAAVPTLLAHHLPGAKSDEDYRGLAALAETWRADAVVFSGAGSRGIEVAYPAPFRETEDLLLRWSATESDTLFGVNVPARWIQPADVAGKAVLQYRMTDGRPADPYARRLHRLGCRVEATAARWRFTAVLLRSGLRCSHGVASSSVGRCHELSRVEASDGCVASPRAGVGRACGSSASRRARPPRRGMNVRSPPPVG